MITYTFPNATGHCPTCNQTMAIPTMVRRLNPNRTDAPDDPPLAAYTFTLACGHTTTYTTDQHRITDTQDQDTTILTFEKTTP